MNFNNLDFSQARVLVIGDIMLDQFWFGHTSRISPEAPVPIVNTQNITQAPGGAANVAANIAALGAQVCLIGIIGNDLTGQKLEQLLAEQKIKCMFTKTDLHPTITKTRILSRNQQLLRLDTEQNFCNIDNSLLWENYQQALLDCNIVIIADYNKGTLVHVNQFIMKAKELGIAVLVDPKRDCFSAYHGANVITPNLKEFEAVVGPCIDLQDLVTKAHALIKKEQLQALVITRSEQGITLVQRDEPPIHLPAVAREVFDVTGAGDTVISVLATALAASMNFHQALYLANLAGGIAVSKMGTVAVTLKDINIGLQQNTLPSQSLVSEKKLLEMVHQSQTLGEHIVFTNGCFDILHAGHVEYLQEAKKLGDRLIVAVNDDLSVAKLKGPNRPVNTLQNRMKVLAALSAVDWVVSFSEDTPERIIKLIKPDVMVKGGDYTQIETLPGAEYVLRQGGRVQILNLTEGCSTTHVINRIANFTKETNPADI